MITASPRASALLPAANTVPRQQLKLFQLDETVLRIIENLGQSSAMSVGDGPGLAMPSSVVSSRNTTTTTTTIASTAAGPVVPGKESWQMRGGVDRHLALSQVNDDGEQVFR